MKRTNKEELVPKVKYVTMPIKYNLSNCKNCGKPLSEFKHYYSSYLNGNPYGFRKYCSYLCVNTAQTQRALLRNKSARQNLICLSCNKGFNGNRKDQKFCSGKCRISSFRKGRSKFLSKNKEYSGATKG